MEGRTTVASLDSAATTSGNLSIVDIDEYPDPAMFNLNDTHDQQLFMQQYQSAQQHDPQIKVAIAVFYMIIVRATSKFRVNKHTMLVPLPV